MPDKPSLSIFTGTKDLGSVFREQNQINVKFIDFNIPFSNTEGNTALNAGGKTRILILQGAHDGTGFDGTTQEQKLADFVYEMEQWVNANVQSKITYTDSMGVSYTVYCVDWSWQRSFDDPFRILWSLMIKEA